LYVIRPLFFWGDIEGRDAQYSSNLCDSFLQNSLANSWDQLLRVGRQVAGKDIHLPPAVTCKVCYDTYEPGAMVA
jgi:hypothetical protein